MENLHAVINVTMLSVTWVFSAIILFAILRKKTKTKLDKPFIRMSMTSLGMLTTGLAAWLHDLVGYGEVLYRIVLAVDFITVYLSSVVFLWYLRTLVAQYSHREADEVEREDALLRKIIRIYSLCLAVGFVIALMLDACYRIEQGVLVAYRPAYFVFMLLSSVWAIYGIIMIAKNHQAMGHNRTILLALYIIVPITAFYWDNYNDMSIGYVIGAAIGLLIYVRINLTREQQIAEVQAQLAKKEAEMAETKMELMMMQIQPHFLYNALSTISWLCTHDPQDARVAVNEFASYLKGNMESINAKRPVPFETELAHVQNYLNIEKRRFPSRLIVKYDIQTSEFMIPTLTLQTLVENAVRHGVNVRFEPTTVCIRTSETPEHYVTKVIDDGVSFDPERIPKDNRQHFGLAGARYRVQEMMNGQVLINSVIGKGTEVTILIPKEVTR